MPVRLRLGISGGAGSAEDPRAAVADGLRRPGSIAPGMVTPSGVGRSGTADRGEERLAAAASVVDQVGVERRAR